MNELPPGDRDAMPFDPREPRYVALARDLIRGIRSGVYPIGSLLPAEAELSGRFGVSRFTVREAIRRLQEAGLVSRHQGVGTRVEAIDVRPRYVQYLGAIEDFWQYVKDTRLKITERASVPSTQASVDLPELDRDWLMFEGFRYQGDESNRICWTRIYLNPDCAAISELIGPSSDPIYVLIEKHCAEKIVEVRQQISAVLLTPEIAELMKTDPATPGLSTMRRYFGTGDRVLEVTISIHPADRFRYDQRLQLEYIGSGKG